MEAEELGHEMLDMASNVSGIGETTMPADIAVSLQSAVPPHVRPELVVDFDYLNDPRLTLDPHEAYQGLAGGPDIVYTPRNGGHWIAARQKIIAEVFQTPALFSNHPRTIPKTASQAKPQPFSDIDPPDNAKYRRLLQQTLGPRSVVRFEQQAIDTMIELTEEIRPKGECDFAADIAQQLPIYIILRWLDLPYGDRFKLLAIADNILGHADPAERKAAKEQMGLYVDGVVTQRRARPRDDLISQLVNGQVGDRVATHEEGRAMVANLVVGGLDTVRNMMSFFAMFLARNDGHRRQLVEDPELIPGAVEELLRWYAIPNMARSITADIDFHGVAMKAGDMILLPLVLAGRDEQAFEDALTVDFRRQPNRHITFGSGAHGCPGLHLARIELRIFLKEWLARIPDFRIRPGSRAVTRGGIILAVQSLPLVWDV
jgi:cytochrome P450